MLITILQQTSIKKFAKIVERTINKKILIKVINSNQIYYLTTKVREEKHSMNSYLLIFNDLSYLTV